MLVLVEGLSSYALLIREVARNPLQQLRHHTSYDKTLGWVSLPNLDVEDMYGPGVGLRTNGRGFRTASETEPARPPDRRRIVCSGDSVTFGQGVDGSQTWCDVLEDLDPALEPINMGQVGYGVDQAFLWYRRDTADLDIDLHVLAFITHNFLRVKFDEYLGFGRPVLVVRDDELELTNVPVPRKGYILPSLTLLVSRIGMLKTAELAAKVRKRLGIGSQQVPGAWSARSNEEVKRVLSLLFEEARQFNDERSRATVLVYLPSLRELENPDDEDLAEWLAFAEAQATAQDVPFFNFVEEFAKLPAREANELFLDGYHLTETGHALVARRLLEGLRADPRSGPMLALD
jgi:lysophospholipase L1-like esterase